MEARPALNTLHSFRVSDVRQEQLVLCSAQVKMVVEAHPQRAASIAYPRTLRKEDLFGPFS